jgi:hypothetical protein
MSVCKQAHTRNAYLDEAPSYLVFRATRRQLLQQRRRRSEYVRHVAEHQFQPLIAMGARGQRL